MKVITRRVEINGRSHIAEARISSSDYYYTCTIVGVGGECLGFSQVKKDDLESEAGITEEEQIKLIERAAICYDRKLPLLKRIFGINE